MRRAVLAAMSAAAVAGLGATACTLDARVALVHAPRDAGGLDATDTLDGDGALADLADADIAASTARLGGEAAP